MWGAKIEAKTDFFHSSLHKKAKNRLFSSIFSSLLILFSFREKRWHGKHRKRKHQQKLRICTRINPPPCLILFRAWWTRRDFIFFEKHPQSVIIFLDFFLLGGFQFSFFHFLFTISSRTPTHTHTHTRSLPITNIGIEYLITSLLPKNWIIPQTSFTLDGGDHPPHVSRFWRRRVPSRIAHFSRLLGSRLTSLAITTFSQQNVFGGSSLSFPLFSCMERNFLAPTSKG